MAGVAAVVEESDKTLILLGCGLHLKSVDLAVVGGADELCPLSFGWAIVFGCWSQGL